MVKKKDILTVFYGELENKEKKDRGPFGAGIQTPDFQ